MKIVFPSLKQIQDRYRETHPPDFMTHFNYADCLNTISDGLNVEYKLGIKNSIKESKILDKKIKLINLIKRSLDEESKTIKTNPNFTEVCVPWIAVKAYYLLFNLFLISEYLISGQESFFNSSHEGLLKTLKDHIERKEIVFGKAVFNTNFRCSKVINAKVQSGANLRIINVDLTERLIQILKKLIYYKLEDFQRRKKIKNFRSKKDRQEKNIFLAKQTVNLCEVFYWYRIKSNYRDLEFLDKDISDEQFSGFYTNYLNTVNNFYNAFKRLINTLAKTRLGKEIL